MGAKEAAEDAEVEAADAEEVGVLGPRDSRFRTRQRALQPRGEEVVEVRGQRPRLRNCLYCCRPKPCYVTFEYIMF